MISFLILGAQLAILIVSIYMLCFVCFNGRYDR